MAFEAAQSGFRVTIKGIVQGVGFRPFVYRQAKQFGIEGMVINENAAVTILAVGERFDEFLESIQQNNPIGSWIESVEVNPAVLANPKGFVIAKSGEGSLDSSRFFSPDIAICKLCLKEIFDNTNRRAGHFFNNCVACGPRFSVLISFPYDRKTTTMNAFEMCKDCLCEYENPEDLRFHAETICCLNCGPVLQYRRDGKVYADGKAFEQALQDLNFGIAIKGIGGYHLACCPYDEDAINRLREIKQRDKKPLAVMFKDIDSIKQICEMSELEQELLTSPASPIVLLKAKSNPFAKGLLYDAQGRIGCFLPYTPLQAMLLEKKPALVMTSANITAMPIITKENEIFKLTRKVLYHNREIKRGIEDSVVQAAVNKPQFIRRGRGYTPLPITLENPDNMQILCIGGDLKASFGLLKNQAFIQSQPFGDLENELNCEQFEQSIIDFENLFAIKPQAIVCDAHPRYFSSILAKQLAKKRQIPLIQVQHHHSHIGSVMAEHGLKKVLGIAMDGTGFGPDGNIWGGEFLVCNQGEYRRAAHLEYTKVIGSDISAKDANKTAACYLYANSMPLNHPDSQVIKAALNHNINTFETSSMGRLFDVVAALLGICGQNSYEGECAMRLQYKAEEEKKAQIKPLHMNFDIKNHNGMYIIGFSDILQKCRHGAKGAALGFHEAACRMILELCEIIGKVENIRDIALSGGVFQNSLLLEITHKALTDGGFNVFVNELVPPNDGGLALGQAYIALNKIDFRTGGQ